MTIDVVALTYEASLMQGGERKIEIVADGESTLSLTFNEGKERREIGVWRHTVARATFQELVERLQASGWQNLEANLIPGFGGSVIGERRAGEPNPTTRAFGRWPDELQGFLASLGGITAELTAHPARVVRGEARVRTADLPKGGDLELDVTLTNTGTLPLRFSNPFYGRPSEWNGLRVVLEHRPQTPNEKHVDSKQFDLKPKDLLVQGLAPTGPTLLLAGGQGVSFSARRKLSVPPGQYELRLQVHNMVSSYEAGAEVIDGMLWLYPGTLVVTP